MSCGSPISTHFDSYKTKKELDVRRKDFKERNKILHIPSVSTPSNCHKILTTGKPNSYNPNPDKATKGTVESGLKNLDNTKEYAFGLEGSKRVRIL